MRSPRRLLAGTGWKMNVRASEVPHYANELRARLAAIDVAAIDIFVLPPFTSLAAAASALAGTPVATGGQNMHWEEHGPWTGEISAPMLHEAGCRYVELAHSERLQHFGEAYERVRHKVDLALKAGLTPILCLGETAAEKAEGRGDAVLAWQLATALAGQPDKRVADVILAYEPRWAIGSAAAAPPEYVAARHAALRAVLSDARGKDAARRTRIMYGGSVTPQNARDLIEINDVDGLFVGRAAWQPEGFAKIIEIVAAAARQKARARAA